MTERQVRNVPPPSAVRPEIPKDIDDLVQRMGAKDPNERPRTAADVVRALHAYLPVAQWSALGLDLAPPKAAEPKTAPKPAVKKKTGFFAGLAAAVGRLFGR